MSAPIALTAENLRNLADFLDDLSDLSTRTGVTLCAYAADHLAVGDGVVQIVRSTSDDGTVTYIVDDRIGD